jgi:hypothetical protein
LDLDFSIFLDLIIDTDILALLELRSTR